MSSKRSIAEITSGRGRFGVEVCLESTSALCLKCPGLRWDLETGEQREQAG